ncbi:hypothetical protein ASG85_17760 [Paenibacillus sp. Soil724D2]|nr:hypothetical protein ASG85_17760 [Paenibacillus sp. Soil724D2]
MVAGGIAEGRQERKTNQICWWSAGMEASGWSDGVESAAGVTQVVFYTTIIWINGVSEANVAENTTILLKRAHFG